MRNIKRNAFIFLFILFQTLLAVSGGLLSFYYFSKDYIPHNVYVSGAAIGGLEQKQASLELQDKFGAALSDGSLKIKYGDSGTYEIKYIDIDARFDPQATTDIITRPEKAEAFINLMNELNYEKRRDINPVITFNEGKLRAKLVELSAVINKEPVNANIYLKDDKITKISQVTGVKLNIDRAAEKISAEIPAHFDSPVDFGKPGDGVIDAVDPQITSKQLEGADEVISKYSTDIKLQDNLASVKIAADAINKVLVFSKDSSRGEDAGVFSFNKYLGAAKGIVEKNDEGYNQVASTLYAAAIAAGIKTEGFARTPHKTPVDYIEPGLDTMVFGNTIDFKFTNTLDDTLIIFADVKDKKVNVYIVSKKKDDSLTRAFKTEVIQRFSPPVTYVENRDLKPGVKKPVSSGKEGIRIKAYLVTAKDGKETEKKYLYDDKYDAEESIVQIGPDTKWEDDTNGKAGK